MNSPNLHIINVASQPGGVGKTHLTQQLEAAFNFADIPVSVFDADVANKGYALTCSKEATCLIQPQVEPFDAEHHVAKCAAMGAAIILDTGAGQITMSTQVADACRSVLMEARKHNYGITTVFPVAANKPVESEVLAMLTQQLGHIGSVVIALNDASGSASFQDSLLTLGSPKVQVPQVPAGVIAWRTGLNMPLSQILRNPPEGRRKAVCILAVAVYELASQEPFASIFGAKGQQALHALASGAPSRLYYAVDQSKQAQDDALMLNEALSTEQRALASAATADPSHQYRRMRDLLLRYQNFL